jgi:L-ascorbate metabolism protein UlaG (beta-lactamase superfamily)
VAQYKNLDGTTSDKRVVDVLKWQIGDRLSGRRKVADDSGWEPPRRDNDGAALARTSPHATWVGHATWLLRQGGRLVATDPIWSDRIHTVKRRSAPGIALDRVPPIDVVTVSHSHFDHLDLPTLTRIGPEPLYVVPKDNAELLTQAGLHNVVELDWWESRAIGDLRVTLVPAQHWSMRAPWDRNKRLWGGFVYESAEGTSYHAGDTGFSEVVFEKIAERFPAIDWAMLPIGAYEPRWFMSPQHMGPEEAVRAFEILGAKNLLAMHWGTYKLTDEHLGEPPERARAAFIDKGHDPSRLWIFDLGETRDLR